MIHTPVCDQLEIDYPIVLGGMATGTSVPLVAAVSNAGGLGTLGATVLNAEQVHRQSAAIREATDKPFAFNYLLFRTNEEGFQAALEAKLPVISFAWANADQDLKSYFQRAHGAGSLVICMAGEVPEAVRAVECGADIIVAQGTEGGGHVGWMASMPLVPMMVDAVAPIPVIAAGGIADGRGLAASLALGAQGVLLGTRFLATQESPIHPNFKDAILRSNGHNTVLTEVPDIANGQVWPGAMARTIHNDFIASWSGREWALRQQAPQVRQDLQQAARDGDIAKASLLVGQDAGLINSIPNAADLIEQMMTEAHEIITNGLKQHIR